MGVVNNISYDQFPEQGKLYRTKVKVCFHYDVNKTVDGEIVRDDKESPFLTIIKLENGKYILGSECQYQSLGIVHNFNPVAHFFQSLGEKLLTSKYRYQGQRILNGAIVSNSEKELKKSRKKRSSIQSFYRMT